MTTCLTPDGSGAKGGLLRRPLVHSQGPSRCAGKGIVDVLGFLDNMPPAEPAANMAGFVAGPHRALMACLQVDSMASRVYNGRFSRSGNVYVGAQPPCSCQTRSRASSQRLSPQFHICPCLQTQLQPCASCANATATAPHETPHSSSLTHRLCCHAAAFQHERKVRVYDSDGDWALRKDVSARNLRWTVTDTDISPSEQFLIYASITPDLHLVRVLLVR